jgi:xylose isomerase
VGDREPIQQSSLRSWRLDQPQCRRLRVLGSSGQKGTGSDASTWWAQLRLLGWPRGVWQPAQLAVEYKKKIGFTGTFLVEPKPKEPTKHQYDFDAAAVVAFLKSYGLDREFKLNIETNHATLAGHSMMHELVYAQMHGLLGSVDANFGDLLLGWDTDQFPTDYYLTTQCMLAIMEQGGLEPGGLNFDAKVRRDSFEPIDLFHAHVGAMDAFAVGLKLAAKIRADKSLADFVHKRYASWDQGIGQKIEAGSAKFEDLETYMLAKGEVAPNVSGRQEMLENLFNRFIL